MRYTYRLRPGVTAERALLAEWGRCRWLWNEAVHQFRTGCKPTLAKLSKLLTEARQRTAWLGEWTGRTVVLVQPAYTTMTCSECFARAKRLRLDERIFACPDCGLIAERDRNAAKVILAVAERGHTSVESIRHSKPPSKKVAGAA